MTEQQHEAGQEVEPVPGGPAAALRDATGSSGGTLACGRARSARVMTDMVRLLWGGWAAMPPTPPARSVSGSPLSPASYSLAEVRVRRLGVLRAGDQTLQLAGR